MEFLTLERPRWPLESRGGGGGGGSSLAFHLHGHNWIELNLVSCRRGPRASLSWPDGVLGGRVAPRDVIMIERAGARPPARAGSAEDGLRLFIYFLSITLGPEVTSGGQLRALREGGARNSYSRLTSRHWRKLAGTGGAGRLSSSELHRGRFHLTRASREHVDVKNCLSQSARRRRQYLI